MAPNTPSFEPGALARTLVAAAPELALDATITPDILAQLSASPAASDAVEEPARITRTPLPHVSISGPLSASGVARASTTADFEITATLGEGGMGRVFLAHQRSVGRDVAIKMPKDPQRGSEPLRVEAITMGRLEHPAIVPVHVVGVDDDGGLVLVMKRVEGVEWRALLADAKHPQWEQLAIDDTERLAFHVEVLSQVANALEYAHGRGVIHRDVKPENVLVGPLGEVYLADWGIASLPQDREPGGTSSIVGTPVYMAPEMVIGDAAGVSARTDVYLLGATLHELLTGEPRHAGRSLQEVLFAALRSAPPVYGADVTPELAALSARATHAEPAERPASALAFRRALDAWRAHRGSLALAQSARALLEPLRPRVLASAQADASGSLRDVDRGLIEARFGFSQALREWPDNTEARAGLRETLTLSVTHELRRGGLEAARALLAEVEEPPAELIADVESLAAEHARRAREEQHLRALARDVDFGIGSSERRKLLALLTVPGFLISLYVWWRSESGDAHLSTAQLLGFPGLLLAASAIGVAARWRSIARNAAGVRLVVPLLVTLVAIFCHRLIGVLTHSPVHAVLAGDLLVFAAILTTAGTIRRRIAWFALPLLCGGGVAALVPTLASHAFTVSTLFVLVAGIFRWRWLTEE